jgi:hypothetical protein
MSKAPAKATTVVLVTAIRDGLPRSHEWDERERALLDLAARQAADIDRLEADIAEWAFGFRGVARVCLTRRSVRFARAVWR